MNRYEKESLFKNFFVFFSLLELLLAVVFMQYYKAEVKDQKDLILKSMQVCSYTFECKNFIYDFLAKDKSNKKLNQLYGNKELYSLYTLPKSKKYYLKLIYPENSLNKDMSKIRYALFIKFSLVSTIFFILSIFFTLYSLSPIRKALKLNDEFIKDILHDFNTPIATMKLNIGMLNSEYRSNPLIKKLSYSMDNILQLQDNMKNFLLNSPSQKESFDLSKFIAKHLEMMQNLYPHIQFKFGDSNPCMITSNKDAIGRILDNLLSNAARYNRVNGTVMVKLLNNTLIIKDNGIGIKDPKAVFDRYYKEQSRGLGLGLHIVKKLCDELDIKIEIDSQLGIGSEIKLDIGSLV